MTASQGKIGIIQIHPELLYFCASFIYGNYVRQVPVAKLSCTIHCNAGQF